MGRKALRLWPCVALFGLCLCGPGANSAPEPPQTPAGPTLGKTGETYFFSTRAFDRDDDSVRFQFYWGDGTKSSWTDFVPSGAYESAAKSWSGTGNYNVQARAKDKSGEVSDSSAVHSISIVQTLPNRSPAVLPVPIGPDSGVKRVFYIYSTTGSDPDHDSIAIQFDWGDGSSSNWSRFVPSGSIVSDSQSWYVAGDYPVRAMARDSKGLISDWSGSLLVFIQDSAVISGPVGRVPDR